MVTLPLGVRARRVLAAALLGLALAVVAWRHASTPARSAPVALRVAPIAPARSPRASPSRGRLLVVDVAGAVRRPGLVRVPDGARVADVVARAGGLARRADRTAVNLAAPVADGQQVLVPVRGSPGAAAATAADAPPSSGAAAPPVSLSSATPEQLDALPGVGPVTAQKIVTYREQHGAFRSVDELDAIPGIGPARIADLRGLVVP
jgi:competence protein ComEA